MSSKIISSFTVDPELLNNFNKVKGFNSKSALISYWIDQYIKQNPNYYPKLEKIKSSRHTTGENT